MPRLQAAREEAPTADSFIEPEPVSPAHILVHDDEAAVLDVVRRYLEDAGHRVLCARDEAELLELARANTVIDVAILDELPTAQEQGSLVGQLLDLRPGVPILFCPGRQPEIPEGTQKAGQRVLWKPFRMNELGFAVQQLLATATGSH